MHFYKTFAVSILLLQSLVRYSSAQGAESTCCNQNPNCMHVTTLKITIEQHANTSPYYTPLSSNPLGLEEANACYTYFPMTKTSYLVFRTVVHLDGSITVQKNIEADIEDYPGVYRVQGLYGDLGNGTTVHNTYIFDAACSRCKPIYLAYLCFFFDSCRNVNYKYDLVIGLSPSVENSPSCLNRFKDLVNATGLRVEGLMKSAGKPKCVVYFNNATCVNANRVDPANAISYPEDTTSCGH